MSHSSPSAEGASAPAASPPTLPDLWRLLLARLRLPAVPGCARLRRRQPRPAGPWRPFATTYRCRLCGAESADRSALCWPRAL